MKNNLLSVHHFKTIYIICFTILFLSFYTQGYAQLAAGKSKFLGNIIASSAPSNFSTYWNQVTPENGGKWGSVEATRNSMNWSQLDVAYNYAKQRGYPFKQHTFVWGSQEPSWIGSLSAADQKAEIEQFIQQYAQRYPNTDFIDVVNEPLHAPATYRNAIGGNGSTGWDWIVWAFQKARQYCPNAKLLINEYGIISNPSAAQQYVDIINILKARGLIDGIGIQCHYFNMDNVSTSTMTSVLNTLAATGLPIYVSELDMTGSETEQRDRYQQKFPVLWNHSAVKGVTLWGYVEGQTWKAGSGLLNSNGTERLAMTWLKSFMAGGGGGSNTIIVRARGTNGTESIRLRVNNTTISTWTLTTSYQNYTATTTTAGGISVEFTNDATNRDAQIDYIQVNGTTRQAEAQTTNTGVYQNGACGGTLSEWLHCNGYIGFGNTPSSAARLDLPEENELVTENEFDKKIRIYPNPAPSGSLNMELTDMVGEIRIIDFKGKTLNVIKPGNRNSIHIGTGLSPGFYIIRAEDKGKILYKRVLIQD